MRLLEVRTLVAAARAGDREAFDELVRRYAAMVFRYALSLLGDYGLAEDAAQESFVTAYFGLSSLRDDGAFGGWLRGITRNHCLRLIRGRRATLVPLEQARDVVSDDTDPQEGAERSERRQDVLGAVLCLPEKLREVVILYYSGEYSQREIAAFLDLPVTTVNNRLHAARRALKGGLIEMVQDDLEQHGLPHTFPGRVGTIIDAQGPVTQIRFDEDRAPRPLEALTVDDTLAYAVTQRLGDGTVRCLALTSAGEARRGVTVTDSGRLVDRPISPAVLRDAVGILLGGAVQPSGRVETGIKAIDLLCPLPASGCVALYGPQGAGKLVVLGELLHRFQSSENSLTLLNFVQADTVHELPEDEPLPNGAGPVQSFYLPVADAAEPASASLAEVRGSLDGAIYCSRGMAAEMLYPAIDPAVSWSRLLADGPADREHCRIATEARALLERGEDVTDPVQTMRARKLRLFLTQPFFTTEAYTGLPGEYVSLAQTLEGCSAILSGECDDLPESAFRFTGGIEQVGAKAKDES